MLKLITHKAAVVLKEYPVFEGLGSKLGSHTETKVKELETNLNNELSKLSKWFSDNRLVVHPQKTVVNIKIIKAFVSLHEIREVPLSQHLRCRVVNARSS